MSNLISGLIAISLCTVFLFFYAVKMNSIPLWIIILANIGFAVVDFVQSIREGRKNNLTDSRPA
ncbi:MAG: hypothetical protein AB1558_06280 [Thermodesulfobacteriota bacterium]